MSRFFVAAIAAFDLFVALVGVCFWLFFCF